MEAGEMMILKSVLLLAHCPLGESPGKTAHSFGLDHSSEVLNRVTPVQA